MFFPFEIDDELDYKQRFGYLAYLTIALCILSYVVVTFTFSKEAVENLYYEFGANRFDFKIWSPLTATLLHGGIIHLVGNMYFLWIYGVILEKVIGSINFVILYISGAIVSIALQLMTVSNLYIDEPCIGASGAISAILGAFFVMLPTAKLSCLVFSPVSFKPIVIKLPAWVVLSLWLFMQLLYSLQLLGDFTGVAFWAHIGGFACGAALGTFWKVAYQKRLDKWKAIQRLQIQELWEACLNDETERAQELIEQDNQLPGSQGIKVYLSTLLEDDNDPQLIGKFLIAFNYAKDYSDGTLMVNLYMQMIHKLPMKEIPGFVHQDAAFAALPARQYRLALLGFYHGLQQGITERYPQMGRALYNILNNQLEADTEAEKLKKYFTIED